MSTSTPVVANDSNSSTSSPPPSSSSSSSNSGGPPGFGGGSSSLYLYTFLATLLLLLSICSIIVLRSLVLRRRHRLLVQEAIRNGTWVPPSLGNAAFHGMRTRSTRMKFDPSKKPQIWEAHMEKSVDVLGKIEWDWDTIKPFSAIAMGAPVSSFVEPTSGNPVSETTATTQTVSSPRTEPPLFHRFLHYFDPNPMSSSSPLPPPVPLANLNIMHDNANDSTPEINEPVARSGPHDVRVAVFIAMPSQAASRSFSQSNSNTPEIKPPSWRSARPPLPVIPNSPTLDQHQPPVLPERCEEAAELPHIELGIADLGVRQDRNAEDDTDAPEASEPSGSIKGSKASI